MAIGAGKPMDAALDHVAKAYMEFEQAFKEQIASGKEPEEGKTRMQILEKLMHDMNSEINGSNLKYVGEILDTIDEDAIIEPKKANS